jgi:carbamoyl-phosphate synthase small subunit
MSAILLLEDGTSFEGISLGVSGERVGEVVLYTGVVGYQEMMTDPTNAGKILVFTYPLIGNYGIIERFNESRRCWIGGLIIKEQSRIYSNWEAKEAFPNFLKEQGLVAVGEIDTRTVAVKIRNDGQMLGIISTEGRPKGDLLKKLKAYQKSPQRDFISQVSVDQIFEFKGNGSGPLIAILDLGIFNSFLEQLKALGCHILLLPYGVDSQEILSLNPDGVVVSSGPEEDQALPKVTETVGRLLGKLPLLGISTGHEIIARALGGKLKKMKLGHHGANYPVVSSSSYKGHITFQNHSFVVDEETIRDRSDLEVTLRNLNDQSIEEMESKPLRMISTQYYPVSPGASEVHGVFRRFLAML